MRLLVSVANAEDAAAAMAGGADVIDAKDPSAGALGAVSLPVFRAIHARVGGACPVSAALGDMDDEAGLERAARAFAEAGAAFVKIGLPADAGSDRIATLVAAAVRGAAGRCDVVAVAYADSPPLAGIPTFTRVAARAGAAGVLLDTADKGGPGLCQLMSPDALAGWVECSQDASLFAALAGRLTAADLPFVRAAGANIAGVRGAACEAGRTGHVAVARVRQCRVAVDSAASIASSRSAAMVLTATPAGSARVK